MRLQKYPQLSSAEIPVLIQEGPAVRWGLLFHMGSTGREKGECMARKPNYGFEKRQKELARKAKKQEKENRKKENSESNTSETTESTSGNIS